MSTGGADNGGVRNRGGVYILPDWADNGRFPSTPPPYFPYTRATPGPSSHPVRILSDTIQLLCYIYFSHIRKIFIIIIWNGSYARPHEGLGGIVADQESITPHVIRIYAPCIRIHKRGWLCPSQLIRAHPRRIKYLLCIRDIVPGASLCASCSTAPRCASGTLYCTCTQCKKSVRGLMRDHLRGLSSRHAHLQSFFLSIVGTYTYSERRCLLTTK